LAVYIEPQNEPGAYNREVFLVLKEFGPFLRHGGDLAQAFLHPSSEVPVLRAEGEAAMRRSLSAGMPKGFEVAYRSFSINGRMLGAGEPIRVRRGERVMLRILNASATEIRSLALPAHTFTVIALGRLLDAPSRRLHQCARPCQATVPAPSPAWARAECGFSAIALPLPSATAHGLRVHGIVRLCLTREVLGRARPVGTRMRHGGGIVRS